MKKIISFILAAMMLALSAAAASNYELPEVPIGNKFSDVEAGRWSYDSVYYAFDNGYMLGVGGNRFDPEGTMTRAMVVTVLWRREKSPAIAYSPVFKDVKDGEWYTAAVLWAKNSGVVMGTSATTFSPEDEITREQLVTMLCRYAAFKELDVTPSGSIGGFPDASAVSDWALAAVVWATDKGLIKGNRIGGKDYIEPQGNATREQFAAVIQRFCALFDTRTPVLKEDPLTEAVEKMEETVFCGEHGALHAEFGAPETLNEQTLSNLFVSALGLDISIY